MAFLRACFLAAIVALGAAIEADEVSFVQQAVRVKEDEDLEPNAATPLAMLAGTRQLPFDIPGNVSMQDLMKMAMDLLVAFRDQEVVNTLYTALRNTSKLVFNFSSSLANSAHNLSIDTENVTVGRSFFLLEHFFLQQSDAVAYVAAQGMSDLRVLLAALPEESSLRTMAGTALAKWGFSNMTAEQVSSKVDGFLRSQTKDALGNSTEFCGKFQRLVGKIGAVETALSKEMLPNIQQMSSFLPGIGSLVQNLAPDVEPQITRFANVSLAVVTSWLLSARSSLHVGVKSVSEVSEAHLNCSLVSVLPYLESSGAQALGGNILLPLLAMMAAWWGIC